MGLILDALLNASWGLCPLSLSLFALSSDANDNIHFINAERTFIVIWSIYSDATHNMRVLNSQTAFRNKCRRQCGRGPEQLIDLVL